MVLGVNFLLFLTPNDLHGVAVLTLLVSKPAFTLILPDSTVMKFPPFFLDLIHCLLDSYISSWQPSS